jgi:hypothetical protein
LCHAERLYPWSAAFRAKRRREAGFCPMSVLLLFG